MTSEGSGGKYKKQSQGIFSRYLLSITKTTMRPEDRCDRAFSSHSPPLLIHPHPYTTIGGALLHSCNLDMITGFCFFCVSSSWFVFHFFLHLELLMIFFPALNQWVTPPTQAGAKDCPEALPAKRKVFFLYLNVRTTRVGRIRCQMHIQT